MPKRPASTAIWWPSFGSRARDMKCVTAHRPAFESCARRAQHCCGVALVYTCCHSGTLARRGSASGLAERASSRLLSYTMARSCAAGWLSTRKRAPKALRMSAALEGEHSCRQSSPSRRRRWSLEYAGRRCRRNRPCITLCVATSIQLPTRGQGRADGPARSPARGPARPHGLESRQSLETEREYKQRIYLTSAQQGEGRERERGRVQGRARAKGGRAPPMGAL
eukprot:scaffold167741_cov34-Tisochrysis_lutea.AAC.5